MKKTKKINQITSITLGLLICATSTVFSEDRPAEKIYNSYCTACHSIGVANAPKTNDKAAWEAKNKTMEEFVASVKKGLNAMPPNGLCSDCNDAEFKAVIEYMMQEKK